MYRVSTLNHLDRKCFKVKLLVPQKPNVDNIWGWPWTTEGLPRRASKDTKNVNQVGR